MYALTCERTQTSTVTTPRSVGNTYPGAIFTQADRAVIPRAYPSSPLHTSTRIPLEVQVFGGFLNSVYGITWIKFVCKSTGANFSRDLALIRGGSPLDHEECCLISRLSDFSKVTTTSWDKY
ncbi:hypothetical protein G5I_12992 [Acromyrmex echinatior]|uniref:Uncharacterized protein n=1 Tax=Acromyrmex echinatior TaxID=103372 RepID=F4X3S9_ACREC|nr:hypothetical protein G5I_12992 [Acromyrmex echinatior]